MTNKEEMSGVVEALQIIQSELKVPKSQYNKFGKYKYRSCEDIMEAVKPHLLRNNCALIVPDELVMIGDRYYVKATATLLKGTANISVTAFARESLTKKGMDDAQITGSVSSYARKYALNGLFGIDDTQDSDASNDHSDKSQGQKADDYAAMSKELWKELNAMQDGDIDQAVKRVVYDHKDAEDKKGLYFGLSEILNRTIEAGVK